MPAATATVAASQRMPPSTGVSAHGLVLWHASLPALITSPGDATAAPGLVLGAHQAALTY
jgi:hypothetical protein